MTNVIEESVRDFLNDIFYHYNVPLFPHRNFIDIHNIDFDTGIIFDVQGEGTNKLIGFDTEAAIQKIYEVAQKPFDSQTKDLIVNMRGLGGGKTKIITELRNILMSTENTLAIAIPLNEKWKIQASFWGYRRIPNINPEVRTVLILIAAIISLVYHVDLDRVFTIITSSLHRLPLEQDKAMAIHIQREVLKHVVEDVRMYRNVDTVIILMDQASRIIDRLKDSCPDWANSESDVLGTIKSGFLDNFPGENYNFNLALVTATLRMSPVGNSQIKRNITPLLFPKQLDFSDIINIWWNTTSNTEAEKSKLVPLAIAINSVPRAIEYVGFGFKYSGHRNVTSTYLTQLLHDLTRYIISRFRLPRKLSPRLIHNIVYNVETTIDQEVLDCIAYSILTNSLQTFQIGGKLYPESNIFVLGIGARKQNAAEIRGYPFYAEDQFDNKEHLDIFSKSYQAVKNTILNSKEDNFKNEDYFLSWLQTRLTAASYSQNRDLPFTLAKLLGIEMHFINELPENLAVNLDEEIALNYEYSNEEIPSLPFTTYKNKKKFIRDIRKLNHYELRVSTEGSDAFNGLFKYYSNSRRQDVVVFWNSLNTKSTLTLAEESNSNLRKLKGYQHIKRVMDANNMPFLYIYVTATIGASSFLGKNKDCLIMRSDQSRVYFGPLWEMYQYNCTL